MGAVDSVVGPDGTRHRLKFKHIPNVSEFPEVRAAYLDFVVAWAGR